MNPAESDAASEAAPTPGWIEDMVDVSTYKQLIKTSQNPESCLLDFVKLELCADQTARELVHLSLLLILAIAELILHSGQLLIR